MSDDRCYTPRQLADRWQSTPEKIIGLIRSGRLRGFNVATDPALSRPRFLIPPEAVYEFETAPERTAQPKQAPRRRRRKLIDLDSIGRTRK